MIFFLSMITIFTLMFVFWFIVTEKVNVFCYFNKKNKKIILQSKFKESKNIYYSIILFSPLEQFEIYNIIDLNNLKNNFYTDIYFTFIFFNFNSFTENIITITIYIAFFFSCFFSSLFFYPYTWIQLFFEKIFSEIENFFIKSTGLSNQPMLISYITLIFSLFFFNIFGMIPFSFTVTSHIIVTLFYSFFIFFGINFFSITKHNFSFFNIFLPKGTPFTLEPLLSYIEIISYFSRIFSLSIRLFANMMAGHALLNIFTSFIFTALSHNGFSFLLSFVGIILILIIILMEIIIACLQVYVFSTLVALYIVDTHKTSHLFNSSNEHGSLLLLKF